MSVKKNFYSDNVSGAAPEILEALVAANAGDTAPYGADPMTEDVIRKFGHNMFGGDFVFSVSRDFVRRCPTPLLLQPGSDKPHPAETSAEIARLAPNLEIQKDWRAPTHLAESIQWVADFLGRHTPKMGDAR